MDNKFFEEFDCFEFEKSSIKVDLEFKKQSTMMVLTFNFSGEITVPCDRCLDEVDVDVEGEEKLIVKFGNEEYDESDEILILPQHEYELSVAKYIYEFIYVNHKSRTVQTRSRSSLPLPIKVQVLYCYFFHPCLIFFLFLAI